jgi:hypothetical protein
MPASDNFLLRYLRRLGAGSLLVSILLHVVFVIIATIYVVSSVQTQRTARFQGGSAGPSGPPALVSHQVQLSRQQPTLAMLNQRLSVDVPTADVALPDLPDLPGATGSGPLSGAGLGSGPGNAAGIGAGAGSGKGPAMPVFGFRDAVPGGSLVGRFYDFKQLANAKPNPDLARLGPGPLAEKELSAFTQGAWNPRSLERFYRAPASLYTTQIFIPNITADEAPRAYGVEKTVQGRAWVAHYRGRISPPVSGEYRFVGGSDDFLVVRIDGRIVLDGGLFAVSTFKTDRPRSPAYPYEFAAPGNNLQKSRRGGFVVGNVMNLRAGLYYNIDILLGEGLGGHFYAHLMVEKTGETYGKDPRGNPILPLLRLVDAADPERGPATPPFQGNGPVWRALPPPP